MQITGKRYYSHTECNLDKDGFWTVHNVMGEGKKEPDGEWEDATYEATTVDRSFAQAYSLALESVLNEVNEKVLYRGFDSFFDAKEFDEQAKLEKAEEDDSKDKSN